MCTRYRGGIPSYSSAPGIIDSGCQHGFVCARAPENSLRNRLDRDSTSREFLGPSNFSVISPSYPESPYYCILIVCRHVGFRETFATIAAIAPNPAQFKRTRDAPACGDSRSVGVRYRRPRRSLRLRDGDWVDSLIRLMYSGIPDRGLLTGLVTNVHEFTVDW